jgi:simple sugar transport system permease protein
MTRRLFGGANLSIVVTTALFVLMFVYGRMAYGEGFWAPTDWQNFLNLFIDNAYLLIMAVGMTFVIISGGIDLSVGSLLGLSTMITASMLEKGHVNPWVVILIVLVIGTLFGMFQGLLIQLFDLPPFIITLAGLYLARGLCYVVSINTIAINDPLFKAAAVLDIPLFAGHRLSVGAVMALVAVVVGGYVLRYTRFGRTIYAIGGNEQSALLMGLPVAQTKIGIYAVSGFCSALSGIVFTFYMTSGYALHGKGMEMDAIASVVIGGTLLTGGAGTIVGTVLGVLVYGTIQLLITFGSFNSWWTRIGIGILVFLFCVMQRVFEARKAARRTVRSHAQVPGAAAAG